MEIQEYRKHAVVKATIDIPDELYRRVKARSAMEGRPLRSVAVELLQDWVKTPLPKPPGDPGLDAQGAPPWLAITRRALQPGMKHDLESIRSSIAAGWAAEAAQGTVSQRNPS